MKNIFTLFVLLTLFITCRFETKKQDILPNQEKVEYISCRLPIPVVDAAFVPLYLAQDSFFKKYGLDVSLEPGSSQNNPAKMVSAGVDEFGIFGGPELLLTANQKGLNLKGLLLLHKESNFPCLVTKKSSGITNVNQLEGKKVGFFYGHISTDVLNALFKQEKINVVSEDVGFNYNRFIDDQIDAQWAFTSTAGLFLPEQGVDINIISPSDYGINTHGFTFFTSKENTNKKRETVQKFVNAIIEATEYSLLNREAAINSILKRKADFSIEKANNQLDLYNAAILNNKRIGQIDFGAIEQSKNMLESVEILPKGFSTYEAFDTSFANKFYN